VVFDFCSKMKVVKIVFWPYHRVEEEETKPLVKTASKSDVGHGRTLHHSPARRLPSAQTRTTRLHHPDGLPDPNARWPDPYDWPGYRWRQHDVAVTSSCIVGMPCQRPVSCHVSTMRPTCHVISREPSRVEPSHFWAEPSREPREKILCSRVYM
jgi:hypothetical protein